MELRLVTNLVEGNKFWVEVKGLTESSKGKAGGTFISVDNVRALVTLGERVRYKGVNEMVLPEFDKDHTESCVFEGEEVLTFRPEERGTQTLLVNTDKIPTDMRDGF